MGEGRRKKVRKLAQRKKAEGRRRQIWHLEKRQKNKVRSPAPSEKQEGRMFEGCNKGEGEKACKKGEGRR